MKRIYFHAYFEQAFIEKIKAPFLETKGAV